MGLKFVGSPQAFDYTWLKEQARALVGQPYRTAARQIPEAVKKLDWDQYQSIRFRADHAVWGEERLQFQVRFFHLGLSFLSPVRMHVVVDSQAREVAYDPKMFDYGQSGLKDSDLPDDLGFAGFQLYHHTDFRRDFAAFLGASYFRAVGGEMQYGLSARGLAIDTGLPREEEFPTFTSFWFERPERDSGRLAVYALLDSPSATGAYRFFIYPGGTTVMDVDAAVYPRKSIARIGIAPLTSMFQYGENDRRMANDWRPEIHDSDGLAMWTGSGEWIWRPLNNPLSPRFNSFIDDNPRGFGLLQRDRNFENYQDDGAYYDLRPNLWVEPKASWGKGAVQLLELPTVDETFDNIVAFWNPAELPQPGQELFYGYRLHWGAHIPVRTALAQVVATRTGIGGIIGQKHSYYSRRFVVDFAGANLAMIGKESRVEPVITASSGEIEITSARPLYSIGGYRAMFDVKPTDTSVEPINLRVYLRIGQQPLTETWAYQWTPPPPDQRHF